MQLPFLKNNSKKNKLKPTVLLILDGWGVAPPSSGNAISTARTPNMDRYTANYPSGQIIASGESVGLPANEGGNSEVGHLMAGAGRVILQSLKKINQSIDDGSFYENKAFLMALDHTLGFNSRLHIMGLVSEGSVHSSIKHFWALIELLKRKNIANVAFHLFTDGRDAPPKSGLEVVKQIKLRLDDIKVGRIASISGRYYAMDRDARWDRTKLAFNAIAIGKGIYASDPIELINDYYTKGDTDEFIKPTVFVKEENIHTLEDPSANTQGQLQLTPVGAVNDNDAVIFLNFRVDRPRQLTMPFILEKFEKVRSIKVADDAYQGKKDKGKIETKTFKREKVLKNLFFVTMTRYQDDFPVSAVAYPPEIVMDTASEIIAKAGLSQFHLAESEKERMVTFYFNGMRDITFPNEDVLIVPSKKVDTYDKKPEMSVYGIVKQFKKALKKGKYSFIIMNLANPDMVAHSGNIEATLKAVEHTDNAIGEIVETALAYGGGVLVTADHGNAEELLTFPTATFFYTTKEGDVNTDHSNNPVPVVIIKKELLGKKLAVQNGSLADVAPTVLKLMGLEKASVMTGRNLLE